VAGYRVRCGWTSGDRGCVVCFDHSRCPAARCPPAAATAI